MEEKKEIKVRLSTVICIVVILILIIALGITYYLGFVANKDKSAYNDKIENEVSNVQEPIQEENQINEIKNDKNTTNENRSTSTTIKGEKFIQFDNEFYELKDIAKEYRECNKIKNYKDFNYDLDGDGVKDKITIRKGRSEDQQEWNEDKKKFEGTEVYIVELNGKKFLELFHGLYIYIVDLNENDKKLEVVIYDGGPSDDPNYSIFSKKGNKMLELINIDGYQLKNDKKGTIVVSNHYNASTSPEIYFEYHNINNSKVESKNIDVSELKDIKFKSSYLYFSKDYKNLRKMWQENDDFSNQEECLKKANIEMLNKDITFKILDFKETSEKEREKLDIPYKIHVQLSDGRKGYIFHIQWAG